MFKHKLNLLIAIIGGIILIFLGVVSNIGTYADLSAIENFLKMISEGAVFAWFLFVFIPVFILLEIIRVYRFTTHGILKKFIGILLIYIFLVISLRIIGVCPAYINRMPRVISREPSPGATVIISPWYQIKENTLMFKLFCRLTGAVY